MEPKWGEYPNFSRKEFQCKCGCQRADMDVEFMDALQDIRTRLGFAFNISSGFRCPHHNAMVSSTNSFSGPHTLGKAADISVSGLEAYQLLNEAFAISFEGIGIKQHGVHVSRFVHLDIAPPAPNRPRPHVWSY